MVKTKKPQRKRKSPTNRSDNVNDKIGYGPFSAKKKAKLIVKKPKPNSTKSKVTKNSVLKFGSAPKKDLEK